MAVQKLQDVVIKMARKHKDIINGQRQNKPLLIADKPLFKEIKQKITHKALNLLLRKWISAGKPVEELAALHQPPPNIKHNICKKECALPIQYSLPCKCFLYYCLVQDKVISPVLIYPRWFFDRPLYITKDSWRMRYSDFCDSDLPFEGNYTSHFTKNY